MYITFITNVKICKGYDFLVDRINLYILNIQHMCEKYGIEYEILICEQIDKNNVYLIDDKIVSMDNVRIIKLNQKYPNPLKHNLIESYGKNACLKEATGKYTCMTSADQLFSEDFFIFIKDNLKLETFYRFATYEVPEIKVNLETARKDDIPPILKQCQDTDDKRLCNPGCFENNVTPIKLGQKSGDIMLLDTESFRKIKGWPETICFVHMDTAVCLVATNNFPHFVPSKNVCTYTFKQNKRHKSDIFEPALGKTRGGFQWDVCMSYANKKRCN